MNVSLSFQIYLHAATFIPFEVLNVIHKYGAITIKCSPIFVHTNVNSLVCECFSSIKPPSYRNYITNDKGAMFNS